MCRKFLGFAIVLALLAFATSVDSSDYSLEMRPLMWKGEMSALQSFHFLQVKEGGVAAEYQG
jgi:hypothetical protein